MGDERWPVWTAVATGYGAGAVAMPLTTLPSSPSRVAVTTAVVAVAVAGLLAALYGRWAARRWAAPGGVLLVAAAALLYAVTPDGVAVVVIAVLAGAGAGLVAGWPSGRWWWAGAAAGAATVVLVRLVVGERPALVAAVAVSVVGAAVRLWRAPAPSPGRAPAWAMNVAIALLALGLLGWTGGNDPRLQWFGPVAWHGPRQDQQVAITFDDGPNATATLAVRDILDRYGVKATFFLVGRALDERPDVARALLADGQLLGNHSYHHDQWRWLDPRYPELERTQAAFARNLGVCPRFYRPPHGERTPFITAQVDGKGMRTVTWDVSGGDWATGNGALVAQRVLARVRPGSIVLLHDGLDGRVNVDRSVIVDALPRILDGLRAKGLTPVRLDVLLGGEPYLPGC